MSEAQPSTPTIGVVENLFEDPVEDSPSPQPAPAQGPIESAEPTRKPRTPEWTLRTAMFVVAGVSAVYGGFLLAAPRFVWITIGGAAELHGSAYDGTRFVGGLMLGIAFAALFVLRSPATQNTLVTVMALQTTAAAAGNALTLFSDEAATAWWFEWGATIVTAAMALYIWWARFKARKLLANDA